MVFQYQLQCIEQIGLGFLDGFSLRKDIGKFFKTAGEPAFISWFKHGSQIQFFPGSHACMMQSKRAGFKLKVQSELPPKGLTPPLPAGSFLPDHRDPAIVDPEVNGSSASGCPRGSGITAIECLTATAAVRPGFASLRDWLPWR